MKLANLLQKYPNYSLPEKLILVDQLTSTTCANEIRRLGPMTELPDHYLIWEEIQQYYEQIYPDFQNCLKQELYVSPNGKTSNVLYLKAFCHLSLWTHMDDFNDQKRVALWYAENLRPVIFQLFEQVMGLSVLQQPRF